MLTDIPSYQICHRNIDSPIFSQQLDVDWFFFDSNLNCNLHCLYCHNERDLKLVSEEQFTKFLETKTKSIRNFSLGCAMEPTMDKRMTKFATLLKNSGKSPTGVFRLQTNGILLDRHNLDELKESGMNTLNFSIDTADPVVHKQQRGGSDIGKILGNVIKARNEWKEVSIQFVTTITSASAPTTEDLIKFAIDNGINEMVLRKMFYHPNSQVIQNHARMKELLMTAVEFDSLCRPLIDKYGKQIKFFYNSEVEMDKVTKSIIRN